MWCNLREIFDYLSLIHLIQQFSLLFLTLKHWIVILICCLIEIPLVDSLFREKYILMKEVSRKIFIFVYDRFVEKSSRAEVLFE